MLLLFKMTLKQMTHDAYSFISLHEAGDLNI